MNYVAVTFIRPFSLFVSLLQAAQCIFRAAVSKQQYTVHYQCSVLTLTIYQNEADLEELNIISSAECAHLICIKSTFILPSLCQLLFSLFPLLCAMMALWLALAFPWVLCTMYHMVPFSQGLGMTLKESEPREVWSHSGVPEL